MAKSKNNVITHGLSGNIGGKTIVAVLPSTKQESSEKQKDHRRKFQKATLYAKAAMVDPDIKVTYTDAAKKGQTAYNVAVADFFNAPNNVKLNPQYLLLET